MQLLLDCCWTYVRVGFCLYTFGLRMCADSTTPSYLAASGVWPAGRGGAGEEGPALLFLSSHLAAAHVETWLEGLLQPMPLVVSRRVAPSAHQVARHAEHHQAVEQQLHLLPALLPRVGYRPGGRRRRERGGVGGVRKGQDRRVVHEGDGGPRVFSANSTGINVLTRRAPFSAAPSEWNHWLSTSPCLNCYLRLLCSVLKAQNIWAHLL